MQQFPFEALRSLPQGPPLLLAVPAQRLCVPDAASPGLGSPSAVVCPAAVCQEWHPPESPALLKVEAVTHAAPPLLHRDRPRPPLQNTAAKLSSSRAFNVSTGAQQEGLLSSLSLRSSRHQQVSAAVVSWCKWRGRWHTGDVWHCWLPLPATVAAATIAGLRLLRLALLPLLAVM